MLYRSLYRDRHETSIAASRLLGIAKLLNALRIAYLVLSAIVLAFAVVHPSPRLVVVAGVFFASSFALQFVRVRMNKRASEVIERATTIRF